MAGPQCLSSHLQHLLITWTIRFGRRDVKMMPRLPREKTRTSWDSRSSKEFIALKNSRSSKELPWLYKMTWTHPSVSTWPEDPRPTGFHSIYVLFSFELLNVCSFFFPEKRTRRTRLMLHRWNNTIILYKQMSPSASVISVTPSCTLKGLMISSTESHPFIRIS